MVLDLSDVAMIDVTVGLAIENAITDALDAQCRVFIYSPNTETTDKLKRLNIHERLGDSAFCASREIALSQAIETMATAD